MKTRAVLMVLLLGSCLSLDTASQTRPSDLFYKAIRGNELTVLGDLIKGGSDVNVKDERGMTPLMYSAWVGSIDSMRALLAAGADPNLTNNSGSTALIFSVREIAKVRLLLERGAKVDLRTGRGRSALLVAAMSDPSAEIVRTLIAAGADVKVVDALKMTALCAAALGNDTETIRMLIKAGLDVNAPNGLGMTPLILASSNGNVEAARMLLSAGADVKAVTADSFNAVKAGPVGLGRFSALHMAAPHGSAALVKALLDAGAEVNRPDVRGLTPLILAVGTDRPNVEVVRLLLAGGADVSAKSPSGESALDWARKVGNSTVIAMLQRAGTLETARALPEIPAPSPVDLKTAAQRSVALLESTTAGSAANGGCASCHAHNMTDLVAKLARAKGLRVDEKAAADRRVLTRAEYVIPMNMLERHDAPGTPDVPISALLALSNESYEPDRITDGMVVNIAARQSSEGRWLPPFGSVARAPMGDGDFSRTAQAVMGLKAYTPAGVAADTQERIGRARRWLETAKPATTEDRNMQLMGLHAAGADVQTLRKLSKAILASQRADGSWSQLPHLPSDAYATGESLWALAVTGQIAPTARAYRNAVRYLLSTQRADGSWFVRSRAVKFQPYFESGFPYGHDQWISSMATGWAAAALIVASDDAPMAALAR